MGYTPDRPFKARPVDYIVMAAVGLATAALVAWAFLG